MATYTGPPAPAVTDAVEADSEDETGEPEDEPAAEHRPGTIERRIDRQIDERVEPVERRLEALEERVADLDDFARISLGERRIKHNEANLAEFSDSLTAFAERTMAKANALEERLQVQTMLLAAVLEAVEDADVDVDLAALERYREERVVDDASEAQLEAAIERLS